VIEKPRTLQIEVALNPQSGGDVTRKIPFFFICSRLFESDLAPEIPFFLYIKRMGLSLTNVVERQVLNIDSTHSKYRSR